MTPVVPPTIIPTMETTYILLYTCTDGYTYRYGYSRTEEGIRAYHKKFTLSFGKDTSQGTQHWLTVTDVWIQKQETVTTRIEV